MDPLEKAKAINGKQVTFSFDDREKKYDAFVICDPNIGISIKPLDIDTISDYEEAWEISPKSPEFYLYCYLKDRSFSHYEFDERVNNIYLNSHIYPKMLFKTDTIASGVPCPFSK